MVAVQDKFVKDINRSSTLDLHKKCVKALPSSLVYLELYLFVTVANGYVWKDCKHVSWTAIFLHAFLVIFWNCELSTFLDQRLYLQSNV